MPDIHDSNVHKLVEGDTLEIKHFETIRSMLFDTSGITLADHKRQMVENRINKRIKELNIPSFDQYISLLQSNDQKDEIMHLVNSLTTNVTHFFRESHHFDHLKGATEILLNRGERKLRYWSAGCSIGAEPYSIAISLFEILNKTKTSADAKILGTDIDTIALAKARNGEFHERFMKGMEQKRLQNFFGKDVRNDEKFYTVKPFIRNYVAYNYLNLNDMKWPMSGPFDFIFCRNVLIYFNRPEQKRYVDKMIELLRPGGFLYLGHSEHSVSEGYNLKLCGQTVYQKPGGTSA